MLILRKFVARRAGDAGRSAIVLVVLLIAASSARCWRPIPATPRPRISPAA